MTQQPELIILPRDSLGVDRIYIDLPDVRVGHARCLFTPDEAIIYSIIVFPEFQHNGYATLVVNMLKSRFNCIVADRVRFTAREFWVKMGFVERPDGNWEYRRPATGA